MKFYPFEKVFGGATDADDVIGRLHLSQVRLALLWQLLRQLEIDVWFDDGKGDDGKERNGPQLVLNTFWDMNHVASIPLVKLLEDLPLNDIDIDQEIAALTTLKNLIEQTIASRQQQQTDEGEIEPREPRP